MKRTTTVAELSDFPQTTLKKLKSENHDWVARLETVTKNGSRWGMWTAYMRPEYPSNIHFPSSTNTNSWIVVYRSQP
jgi:hypothetical protein